MTAKAKRIGQRFKHCVVVAEYGRDKKGNILWSCLCDCGKEFTARGYELTSGRVISCKCAPKAVVHGKASSGKKRSKIYSVWSALVNRCTNPKDRNFAHYGGRGIDIEPSWKKFEAFYTDVGDPPFAGATLDRRDNNGNYTKDNCRWVTQKEQARNTRSNRSITFLGRTQLLVDWCQELECGKSSIYYRVKDKNMTFEEALSDVYARACSKKNC